METPRFKQIDIFSGGEYPFRSFYWAMPGLPGGLFGGGGPPAKKNIATTPKIIPSKVPLLNFHADNDL